MRTIHVYPSRIRSWISEDTCTRAALRVKQIEGNKKKAEKDKNLFEIKRKKTVPTDDSRVRFLWVIVF
jgi:hypothetical protein